MNPVRGSPTRVEVTDVSESCDQLPDNVVAFIVVARHNGMSYHRIASLMNRIGLTSARGGSWYGSTVARVAHRHAPFARLPERQAG